MNKCLSCRYFHGQKYDYFQGRHIQRTFLVCAPHPLGQENCPDFEPNSSKVRRTIRITHHYWRTNEFNGVRTDLSLESLKLACAYLQLLRWELPYFSTILEDLDESEYPRLLEKFYGCESIIDNCQAQ